MKQLALVGGVIALLSCSASAAEPERVIENPEWAQTPTGSQLAAYYPDRAARRNQGGWAIMRCRATADGRLTHCRVAAEAPEGWDFGHAVLAIASEFRLKTPKPGEPSIEGASIDVPVTWTMNGGAAPARTFIPGNPSSLVTILPDQAREQASDFQCPSKAEPERRCRGHQLTWVKRPTVMEIAELIRKAGDGLSIMECTAGNDGVLHSCEVSNDGASLEGQDFLSLAGRFIAPPEAEDGTQTNGGRVLLSFDWKVLGQMLKAQELM